MLNVPNIEAGIGIEVYVSKTRGIGGVIKRSVEDFIVEEILLNGLRASIHLEENRVRLADHGRYLICVLVKRGWDTLLAIENIAKMLDISTDRIGFAGIKDANAITAQYISIGGIPIEKIFRINLENIWIKPLGYANEEISPKNLFGNKFTIMVNSINLKETTVLKRVKKIMEEITDFGGLPNFFGHQRFGTIRSITHVVGKHIIKGDFKSAALAFLAQESPFESPGIKRLRREIRETMNFRKTLRKFPEKFVYERLMLEHLSKKPNDFIGALNRLPLNLRKLFVQAYQSFLFNKFLSERIRLGVSLKEAQIGDYVLKLDEHGLPLKKAVKVEANNLSSINQEVRRGKMALALPLVGLKQPLSEGLQGEIEREVLEIEDIRPEDFRNPLKIKVNAFGNLRTAVTKIMNFNFEILKDKRERSKNSVKFRFTLHRGAYATILLREFMKPPNDRRLIKSGF